MEAAAGTGAAATASGRRGGETASETEGRMLPVSSRAVQQMPRISMPAAQRMPRVRSPAVQKLPGSDRAEVAGQLAGGMP